MSRYALNPSGSPSWEIVTLAEAKSQCRVETAFTTDDTYITGLIVAAGQLAEAHTDRAIRKQKYIFRIKRFPCGREPILLPLGNFLELNDTADPVSYVDSSGVAQTLEDADLLPVDQTDSASLSPAVGEVWPPVHSDYPFAVAITYYAGYADAASVPQLIKQAILLQIASMYEFRENLAEGSVSKIAVGFEDLLAPFKVGDEFTEYGVSRDGSC